MARLVDQRIMGGDMNELSPAQKKEALKKIEKMKQANRLRCVRLACCVPWLRDPLAQKGDRMWCETHADWSKVVDVKE